ncbi:MAG: hypothetical protein HYX46_00710 [Betaproteobacteria bacterium]|nr:hypothetical protein [Betaproteobacteria bacterium]
MTDKVPEIRGSRILIAALGALFAATGWAQAFAGSNENLQSLANGLRHKHDASYFGYTGYKWERDYGILGGRCETGAIAAAIGGTVGGVAGSRPAKGAERATAILLGSAIVVVIAAKVGRSVDDTDRACIGHALELAANGRTVAWVNPDSRVRYELVPMKGFYTHQGVPCREFSVRMRIKGSEEQVHAAACRRDEGLWGFVSPVAS